MKSRSAVIAVLLLGGCSMETGQSVDTTALNAVITKIQDYTKQICSYIPTDGTVKQILASVDPLAESAYNIAAQICKAVTETPLAVEPGPAVLELGEKPASCPMVAGVCIEGSFVPKYAPKEEAP